MIGMIFLYYVNNRKNVKENGAKKWKEVKNLALAGAVTPFLVLICKALE